MSAPVTVRAWELRPGDVLLAPVGFTVTHVRVDEPGRAGRLVHVTHQLGPASLPLNALVTVLRTRVPAL